MHEVPYARFSNCKVKDIVSTLKEFKFTRRNRHVIGHLNTFWINIVMYIYAWWAVEVHDRDYTLIY